MTKALLIMLGAGAGFIEGVFLILLLSFSLSDPFGVIESGVWLDFPSLIFGGIGAVCGAILVWTVYEWAIKPRIYVPIPRVPPKVGDPPYQGPFG